MVFYNHVVNFVTSFFDKLKSNSKKVYKQFFPKILGPLRGHLQSNQKRKKNVFDFRKNVTLPRLKKCVSQSIQMSKLILNDDLWSKNAGFGHLKPTNFVSRSNQCNRPIGLLKLPGTKLISKSFPILESNVICGISRSMIIIKTLPNANQCSKVPSSL